MNSISVSGGTLEVVQDTEAELLPLVWFRRHSALIGGGMSTIQTVVWLPRIVTTTLSVEATRSKHSTCSVT